MSARGRNVHYAWLVLVGCCCVQAGGLGLVINTAGVFFAPVCAELGFSQGGISAYLTYSSWATCIGMVLVARLFPRYDTRVTMSLAAGIVTACVGAMGAYTQLWQWYVSGVVIGLAGCFLFVVPVPILVGNWFEKSTGLATGVAMAFSGIGAAAFSPLFTALIDAVGWRAAYFVAAAFVAVLILPWTLFVIRFSPEELGMNPYGWSGGKTDEGNSASPAPGTVPLGKAVRSGAFALMFVFAGLCSAYGSYSNQLPTFALDIGQSAMFGAALISVSMTGNIVSKVATGFIIDRVGVVATSVAQILCIAAALLAFALSTAPAVLYAAAFVYGFQNGLLSVNLPLLVREVFGLANYTEMLSYINAGTGIVGGAGFAVVGMAYDAFGSYDIAFLGGVIMSIVAIVCIVSAWHVRRS